MKRHLWLLWVLLLATLTSCQTQSQTLIFTTLAGHEMSGYTQTEPAIVVITNATEADNAVKEFFAGSTDIPQQLNQLNYTTTFALLIFQGQKGSAKSSVTVQSLQQIGATITVTADFVTPAPNTRHFPVMTSPYHLIAVQKGSLSFTNAHFLLVDGSALVAEAVHFIP